MHFRFYPLLPRSLKRQLMLLTAVCLVASILGYGAYTAQRQTDLARQTITAQMSALAKNLATINAHLLMESDLVTLEAITIQTATVPGIFSVLVTDVHGRPLSEVVNNNGKWSPRFSTEPVALPTALEPTTQLEAHSSSGRDFLAGDAGKISAWHPIGAEQPIGWVRVSYRLDSFHQTAKDIWTQALLVIALAISATLLLLSAFLRAPIRALHTATRFAGDLDHALGTQMEVSSGTTEMRALGRALNTVSARLFTQNHDLTNQMFALDQHAIVSMTDLQGVITYANTRFCEISGYTAEELLGQNHRMVKSDFHAPAFYAELWNTISQGQVWHGEIKNRAKNGHAYWVAATIVPLMDAHGLPQQYIGIRTDITKAKALEQSLQVARATAEAANQAKSDFLANMSHEIRTPMNGVIGMTELALDTALDPVQHSYLRNVQSSAQALLVILNDILDFSKIEAGKMDLEHIPFPLPQVISDVLQSAEARTHQKGLTLTSDVAADLPAHLLGDPGRIRQVLTNLCDNAIKFTQHGGVHVKVSLDAAVAEGYEVHIAVSDTGVGIAPAKQALIFAAFSQADSSTTRQFGGTGLGLTISARLVELMGGRLWVDSTPGQGSTFHFTVRLRQAPTSAPAPAPALPASVAADRALHILLVEDHAINQMLATALLKKSGHSVVLAHNGQEAVDLFPTQHWDAVLMDMQMPVMGGLEATRLIRATEPSGQHTPIIAVTANAMEADREACMQAGMDDFLAKPISAAALQDLLNQYCP